MTGDTLVRLSDLAVEGAMAGYLVALLCHAAEMAGRRARRPEPAVEQSTAAQLVAAGPGASGVTDESAGADPSVGRAGGESDDAGNERRHTGAGDQFAKAAVIVTAVGFACHVIGIVLRGIAAGRGPWGDMYEFTLMITGAAVAAWLVAMWRNRGARAMGIYVMTPMTLLLFLAGTVLYTGVTKIEPILHSYWLNVHVLLISLSAGVLMLSGLSAATYLVRIRHDARVEAGTLTGRRAKTRLPMAATLDRIAYRATIIAFPFYTFAIIAGAMWAEVAWGKYWGWDPKEVVALVSWVIYAGYLHARSTAGWRGKPAAWICVIGLASILFNLFFVNMVVSGLHSYAGLN